jgi:2,4-dienoyl-CoA reductase-like NADH-dependent reductase (Old Yellow Enzyme family)
LIDTSSGGNWAKQKIPIGPGYQSEHPSACSHFHLPAEPPLPCVPVPFAAAIKKAYPDLPIGAVGLLTTLPQIEEVLSSGKADVAFVARQIMRDVDFVLEGAEEMGVIVKAPVQNERGEWPYQFC